MSALFGVQLLAAGAQAQQPAGPPPAFEPVLTSIQIANLPLGVVTFPNGKAINLTVALGSAAFRQQADAPGRVWLLTNRGPSISCMDAKRVIGLEPEAACAGDPGGRIYPLPGFVPSIYGVDIGKDHVARINAFLPLKGRSGRPVSGRPTPMTSGPKGENVHAVDGKLLPPDPSGVDPEGLVRLSDSSFWIAEEFGPSLLEVGPDGTIRRRLVPDTAMADFKDADYDIVPALPGILRQRKLNHGFEALALSPDESYLYTVTQSPLAQPDEASTLNSRALRIYKIERASGKVVGQFLYQSDLADRFTADNETRLRAQSEVRISEMAAIGPDRLLVLEQIDKSSRLYFVSLDDAHRIPPEFDSPGMAPSLEALDAQGLALRALSPLPKSLVLDTDKSAGLPGRIEGLAVISPNEVLTINDNDFAIDGVRTQMYRVILPSALLNPAPQAGPAPLKSAPDQKIPASKHGTAHKGQK